MVFHGYFTGLTETSIVRFASLLRSSAQHPFVAETLVCTQNYSHIGGVLVGTLPWVAETALC